MIPTNIITIYGRKPIAEVIDNQAINIWRLHLSKTNKQSIILNQIINAAKKKKHRDHRTFKKTALFYFEKYAPRSGHCLRY